MFVFKILHDIVLINCRQEVLRNWMDSWKHLSIERMTVSVGFDASSHTQWTRYGNGPPFRGSAIPTVHLANSIMHGHAWLNISFLGLGIGLGLGLFLM